MEKVKVTGEETSLSSPSVFPYFLYFISHSSSPLLFEFGHIWRMLNFMVISGCNMSADFFCEGVGKLLNFVSIILSLWQLSKNPLHSNWEQVSLYFYLLLCQT